MPMTRKQLNKMEESVKLKKEIELRELELNALLEITQAINNNMSEESLYRIYNFTLRANLSIDKIALYVKEDSWNCKVSFGTDQDCIGVALNQDFVNLQKPRKINYEGVGPFNEFKEVWPIAHKDKLLAVVFIDFAKDIVTETEAQAGFIVLITNIIMVAIENKKLARREMQQELFRKEMDIAKNVQSYLFPDKLPEDDHVHIFANYWPHHTIGGDYYDVIPLEDNKLMMCIADVSGKGIPAALLMSNFQASLRTLVRKTDVLKDIVEELNYQILRNANGENFITVFLAIYDKKTRQLDFINAGHNPPFLVKPDCGIEFLEEGTTILGVFNDLPFLREGRVEVDKDSLFFLYTDGVTETINEKDEFFGVENLLEFFKNNKNGSLKKLHDDLYQEITQFKGNNPHHDDITIMTVKVMN